MHEVQRPRLLDPIVAKDAWRDGAPQHIEDILAARHRPHLLEIISRDVRRRRCRLRQLLHAAHDDDTAKVARGGCSLARERFVDAGQKNAVAGLARVDEVAFEHKVCAALHGAERRAVLR